MRIVAMMAIAANLALLNLHKNSYLTAGVVFYNLGDRRAPHSI